MPGVSLHTGKGVSPPPQSAPRTVSRVTNACPYLSWTWMRRAHQGPGDLHREEVLETHHPAGSTCKERGGLQRRYYSVYKKAKMEGWAQPRTHEFVLNPQNPCLCPDPPEPMNSTSLGKGSLQM